MGRTTGNFFARRSPLFFSCSCSCWQFPSWALEPVRPPVAMPACLSRSPLCAHSLTRPLTLSLSLAVCSGSTNKLPGSAAATVCTPPGPRLRKMPTPLPGPPPVQHAPSLTGTLENRHVDLPHAGGCRSDRWDRERSSGQHGCPRRETCHAMPCHAIPLRAPGTNKRPSPHSTARR